MGFTKREAVYCLSLVITNWANYSTKNTCLTNEQFPGIQKVIFWHQVQCTLYTAGSIICWIFTEKLRKHLKGLP